MTQVASLIAAFERRLVQEDPRLRASSSQWMKSGAIEAPLALLRTLDALHADMSDFHRRAGQLKLRSDGDSRARGLLVESLSKHALGIKKLRLAAGTTNPRVQTTAFRQADTLIKSATNLFAKARAAAG